MLSCRARSMASLPNVLICAGLALVFYSCIGDTPERLFHRPLDISGRWPDWPLAGPETEILRPEREWEGAHLPLAASAIGATGFANQLRDPALHVEDGRVWLIYAGGGEAALGLAQIDGIDVPQPR